MADTKISALTSLTGAGSTADGDELPIVDVSDTTMAASGTTKAISMADLASGVFERPLADSTDTTPAAPASGIKVFSRNRPAGFRRLAMVDPDGRDAVMQAGLWNNSASWMMPNGNATTLSVNRLTATAIGTAAAARNWATTNLLTSLKRISYASAATAGSSGGVKHNILQWWRGNAAGLGGFFFSCRFGIEVIPATRRWFCGLYGSTTNPSNAEPSTFLNCLGVGQDTGDTVPQFMHNDGTGAATKSAATGVANPTTAKCYEVRVFCAPNSAQVTMSVQDLNVSNAVLYTATTDLPAATQGLLPLLWVNNGATAAIIDVSLVSMYLETDY